MIKFLKYATLDMPTPNVVVEWLKHLLHILEVPDSNLGLRTGYPD
jgi:hypothetical protein